MRSATELASRRERGAVLVTVLLIMLLFVAMGGAALILTGQLSAYERNRELTLQATYAAEAGLHKAVTQMMTSPGLSSINTGNGTLKDLVLEPGYEPLADAIIEDAGSNQYRVYARGRAGNGRVTKYLRAYLKITAVETATVDGNLSLWDWQEITEQQVRDHLNSLPDTDPNKTYFKAWFGL